MKYEVFLLFYFFSQILQHVFTCSNKNKEQNHYKKGGHFKFDRCFGKLVIFRKSKEQQNSKPLEFRNLEQGKYIVIRREFIYSENSIHFDREKAVTK